MKVTLLARARAAGHTWAAYVDRLLGLYASAASASGRAAGRPSGSQGRVS